MNIILFESGEWEKPLSPEDPRIVHLDQILKRSVGEEFDAGVIDGPRGKGVILGKDEAGVSVRFVPTEEPAPLAPLVLAVGACRPQTVRKVLLQATAMGVREIHFFATGRSEQSYLRSKVYRSPSIRPYLIEGAQQAFCTRLPRVQVHETFASCLEELREFKGICLDNYEAQMSLPDYATGLSGENSAPVVHALWVGSERGWSDHERTAFREENITLCRMGHRVLRTETAVVAGLALCLGGMGHLT